MTKTPSETLASSHFIEQWKALAYTYGGMFVLDGKGLDKKRLKLDLSECRKQLKAKRVKRVPRFFSRYVIVIVYCAPSFDEDTSTYLMQMRQRGIRSMHIILFETDRPEVIPLEAMQNDTILYFDIIDSLQSKAVAEIQKLYPKLNSPI